MSRRLPALCAVAFFLLLLAHVSERPKVLSRYSYAYFALLLAIGAGLLGALLLARTRRWGRLVTGLSEVDGASVARFLDAHSLALIAAALALHGGLVLLFLPPGMVFSDTPLLHVDYAHHFGQVEGTVEALSTAGRHWSWDPSFCAGYPAGTLFDVDMKLFEGVAWLATRFGAPLPLVFNCLVLVCFLLPPVILLLACRNFRVSRSATFFVVALGSLIWHADSLFLHFNESGMCTFVLAAYGSLLIASLLYRLLERPTPAVAVGLPVAVSIGWMLHVTVPVMLAAPCVALYVVRFRRLTASGHALVLITPALAVAANWWWVATVFEFLDYRETTLFLPAEGVGPLFQKTLSGNLDLPLALLGLWGFWNVLGKRRAVGCMGILAVLWFFFLSHLSGDIPLLRSLEPYRFQIPLWLYAVFGVVVGVAGLAPGRRLGDLPLRALLPVTVIVLFFGLRLVVPASPFRSFQDEADATSRLAAFLAEKTGTEGRVAFLDLSPGFPSGAMARYLVEREYIGGPFSQMNLTHSYASCTGRRFLDRRLEDLTQADLEKYARLFNIRWIVTTTREASAVFQAFGEVVELTGRSRLRVGDRRIRRTDSPFERFAADRGILELSVFEVAGEPSWFLEGTGHAKAARNRIVVTGASPGGVVLKYHWLETWAVEPEMPIRRHPVPGSPIGFIEVENGTTRDFTIYNSYGD